MLRVANRTWGQDQIVGCKKGESGRQRNGRTVNAVKFSKPKGNLVIGNCPAWTVVTGLSLIQWGFSDSHTDFLTKDPFPQKKWFNTSLMTVQSSDQTHSWHRFWEGVWGRTFIGGPGATLLSNGHTWAAAPLLIFPLMTTPSWKPRENCFLPPFLSLVVKFVWLHAILKNIRKDGGETKTVFHVRYISSEQRVKWTLHQWKKNFFCFLWFTFPNNLLVEVN